MTVNRNLKQTSSSFSTLCLLFPREIPWFFFPSNSAPLFIFPLFAWFPCHLCQHPHFPRTRFLPSHPLSKHQLCVSPFTCFFHSYLWDARNLWWVKWFNNLIPLKAGILKKKNYNHSKFMHLQLCTVQGSGKNCRKNYCKAISPLKMYVP